MVVGGGPGGMEAARVAALRGHKVKLYEKADSLGEQLKYASAAEFKAEIRDLVKYFETQLQKLGIIPELGKEVTRELVEELKPDVVIVATGVTPFVPNVAGIERGNVALAEEVLIGAKEVGPKVVVMGGGRSGCEVARFLSEKGKKVTIVEMRGEIAADMTPDSRIPVIHKLAELGVVVLTNKKFEEITDRGIVAIDRNWQKHFIEADSVVLALGGMPQRNLEEELRSKVPKLYAVGDCVQPGRVSDAIHQGAWVGREI